MYKCRGRTGRPEWPSLQARPSRPPCLPATLDRTSGVAIPAGKKKARLW